MSKSKQRVAVIGAGFTGLTAAYELVKQGYDVTVYEASDNLGGLVSGFELQDGTKLERAYHFLYKTDDHIMDLCKELGIIDKLHFYPSSLVAFYENKPYSLVSPLDLIKFTPISFIDRIRTGITGLRLQSIKKWQPLTEITAYDWLVKTNGKKATDIMWKPLLKGKFDVYWDQVTMAWLWTRIKVRQESRSKSGKEELGYFTGGFSIVIDSLVAKLKDHKTTFKMETMIDSITKDGDKTVITAGKKSDTFDAVISTTPSNVFSKITAKHEQSTEEYRAKLASVDYLGAVLQVFTTTKPITDKYWHQIHDADAPFLVLLSLDALTGTEVTNGNHIYYIGDYCQHDSDLFKADTKTIEKQWFAGVKKLLPEFDESIVKESHVFKYGNAQHIVGTDYESKLPAYKTPLDHVYLSNFSQIFPEDRGTNYAVREGIKVAKMVAEELK